MRFSVCSLPGGCEWGATPAEGAEALQGGPANRADPCRTQLGSPPGLQGLPLHDLPLTLRQSASKDIGKGRVLGEVIPEVGRPLKSCHLLCAGPKE